MNSCVETGIDSAVTGVLFLCNSTHRVLKANGISFPLLLLPFKSEFGVSGQKGNLIAKINISAETTEELVLGNFQRTEINSSQLQCYFC